MTSAFAARRRAEAFDHMVDGSPRPVLRDAEIDQFLAIVDQLRGVPAVAARPAFVFDLRERLMLEAQSALSPVASVNERLTVAPRRTARERRIALAVGGFAIVGATTSMAVAAQSALPGDLLYPLKRAIENVHAGVSVDDSSKGSTLLDNASGRLDEIDELTQRDGLDPVRAEMIARTLGDFAAQTSEASELLLQDFKSTGHQASITELRNFAATALKTLTRLESLVPDGARSALISAAQVLARINLTLTQLCPTCEGLPLGDLSAFLTDPFNLVDNTAYAVPRPDRTEHADHSAAAPEDTSADTEADSSEPASNDDEVPVKPVKSRPSHGDRRGNASQEPADPAALGGALGGSSAVTVPSPELPPTGLSPVDEIVDGLAGQVTGSLNRVLGSDSER